jgi:hypothetical protein
MIRERGTWRRTSWNEARAFVAGRLRDLIDRYGPDSIGVLGSARATNGDNYLAQELARAVIGTNNIDSRNWCASRGGPIEPQTPLVAWQRADDLFIVVFLPLPHRPAFPPPAFPARPALPAFLPERSHPLHCAASQIDALGAARPRFH